MSRGFQKGTKFSNEHRKNLSIGHKGQIAWNKGIPRSKETKEKIIATKSKQELGGKKHARWKGGIRKEKGYLSIWNPKHPFANKQGYVKRSRLIMEKHISRYLTPKEVVHHINRIKTDDRIENLMLFANHSKHFKFHWKRTP